MAVELRPPPARPDRPPRRPGLGETLRQAWREYRSMRTALVLLVVLAAASILGSLFPQEGLSPQRVDQYFADHPALAPVLERLGLFDVFGSAWYMAIYLALLGALVACLVPRTRALVRVLRSRPPRGGDLARYRTRASFDTPATPDQAVAAARQVLRRNRFRLAGYPEGSGEPQGGAPVGRGELAGEKGYLREVASLLFHVSLLVLLVGLAYGKGYGYRGQAAIVEGETWANARVGYDSFSPGRFFGPERLAPFQLRLDDFTNSFYPNNTPREFVSRLTALDLDGRELQAQRVAPNRPMTVDGVRIFQSDYGYVPVVGVRDKAGRELLAPQEVLTLRDPASEWSTGAVKVTRPDPQVGLELTMFTGLVTARAGRRSATIPGWSGRCWWCSPTRATSGPTGPRACSPSTGPGCGRSGTGRCCWSPASPRSWPTAWWSRSPASSSTASSPWPATRGCRSWPSPPPCCCWGWSPRCT